MSARVNETLVETEWEAHGVERVRFEVSCSEGHVAVEVCALVERRLVGSTWFDHFGCERRDLRWEFREQ